MSTASEALPKAFAVLFKDLGRWDYGFFRRVSWQWPSEFIGPIGQVLTRKQIEVSREGDVTELPIIKKISFGGRISITEPDERKGYKGRLFWANAGDLIYSKIRVKQGSLAIVPSDIPKVAVSNEYPVYEVKAESVDPTYLRLVLKSRLFLILLEGLAHGGSSKTRIPPDSFEKLEIPLPPREVQIGIVAQWQTAQNVIQEAYKRVELTKVEIDGLFSAELGLKLPPIVERPKAFAALWKDLHRWSVSYSQATWNSTDITQGLYPAVDLDSILESVQYGTSNKANSIGEGVPVIRMNNIVEGDLDLTKIKYVKLTEGERASLLLNKGDILINRTNSKELVGKCAVFESENEYVFASYLIRMTVNRAKADPHFVAYFINSRLGRQQIDAVSRQIIGQANINSEEIRSLQIPLPPLTVQQTIMAHIQEGRSAIERERKAAAQTAREAEAELEALILGMKKL